jgi:riboflavin synthase
MFTGIIIAVGSVIEIIECGGDKTFIINVGNMELSDVMPGDSISINGACLTVVNIDGNIITVDVSSETLSCTNFGEYVPGQRVNMERALQVKDRLNGHLVSGHIDAVGIIKSIEDDERSSRYKIELAMEFQRYLCKKGSICIDGVSLTINEVSGQEVDINIIPYTKLHTIFSDYIPGSRVNVEIDIIARYLESLNYYR